MTLKSIDKNFTYLAAMFIAFLVTSNLIAAIKLVNLYGFVLPVAFFIYAATFTITDIISEVYGKEVGYSIVRAGFVANVIVVGFILIGALLPPLSPDMQNAYNKYFVGTTRVIVASMIAYLVSQHHDVWAFHFWKQKTHGKHLWLRNNASTLVSQLVDTVLFITIAFYGAVPTPILKNMIISQYLWKAIVALIDTPFVYLGVKIIRQKAHPNSYSTTYPL